MDIKTKREIVETRENFEKNMKTKNKVTMANPAIQDVESSYPCNQCHQTARTQRNLKRHIQSVHQGVRYPCAHCGKQFSEQGHLK